METLLLSAAVTLIATPLALRVMRSRGVMDVPNHRSSHTSPIARGGGIACLLGIIVAATIENFKGEPIPWTVLHVAGLLGLVGLADDRQSLSAIPRLSAQVLAGAVMGNALGNGFWIALGAIAFPMVVNIVNFMDGINGITSLTMTGWGITALLVGQNYAIPQLSIVGGLAAGSALGFLPWNAPTARIFLGDSGSYLFGALAASGLLLGWAGGAPVLLISAPLTLYLLDTGTILVKHVLRRESIFLAHREHIYQKLATIFNYPHGAISLAIAGSSAVITVSWMAPALWVPLGTTAAICVLYLLAPRLASNFVNRSSPATNLSA